jgi:hypothetical protein
LSTCDLLAAHHACVVLCCAVMSPQELVDSARRLLDANTAKLQQLCARSGFTPPDDKGVHEAYGAAVKEWEGQMVQRYAGEHGRSRLSCCHLQLGPPAFVAKHRH